jgi:hypothetical protein
MGGSRAKESRRLESVSNHFTRRAAAWRFKMMQAGDGLAGSDERGGARNRKCAQEHRAKAGSAKSSTVKKAEAATMGWIEPGDFPKKDRDNRDDLDHRQQSVVTAGTVGTVREEEN